jgi:hypothetical protein
MRLFRSEENITGPGEILGLMQLQALARRWYGDRLDPNWRPRTRDESQAILDEVALAGDFWRLP